MPDCVSPANRAALAAAIRAAESADAAYRRAEIEADCNPTPVNLAVVRIRLDTCRRCWQAVNVAEDRCDADRATTHADET